MNIPAYSLEANNRYEVRLYIVDYASDRTGISVVHVDVLPAPLVAKISSGTDLPISSGRPLTLSAEGSYDANLPPTSSDRLMLSHIDIVWACEILFKDSSGVACDYVSMTVGD